MAAKRKRRVSNAAVYDSAGKFFTKAKRKAAKILARAIGGTVGKPKRSKNPLPIGRTVTVKAQRMRNGKVRILIPRRR
jgi:hypothetical protein